MKSSRRGRIRVISWLLGTLFLISCAPAGNVFVLMPDPEGKVGAITVSNEKGTRTLEEEGRGIFISDPQTPPSAPRPVSNKEIRRWFGDAMAIEPAPPKIFTLFFVSGTAELTPESRQKVSKILETIRDRDSRDISVVGHSDRKGSEELNWELSLERAEAVHQILMEAGVPTDIISTTSHGEGNPLIPTDDDVPEPRNRRVEVTVR